MTYHSDKCFPFTERGFLIKEDTLYHHLGEFSYNLLCVIHDNLLVSEYFYPSILAPSEKSLFEKIKVQILAEKNHIKYVTTNLQRSDDQKNILVFKEKNKDSAILLKYITDNLVPQEPLDPIFYIVLKIQGYDENRIRGGFLFEYVHKLYPKKFEKEFEKISEDPHTSSQNKYQKKWDMIKKDDNFEDFGKRYSKIHSEGLKLLEKVLKGPYFKKYSKTVKIHNFHFDPERSVINHPLYTSKLQKKVEECKKKSSLIL